MKQVTEQEYRDFFKSNENLRPISSFSDPDGISTFGYGVPAMDTDWGTEEQGEPLASLEVWKCEYFLSVC